VVTHSSVSKLHLQVAPLEYETPNPPTPNYFADAFKDTKGIGKKWILSEAKKDGADDTIAKYDGRFINNNTL
jgi:hypothetical protein